MLLAGNSYFLCLSPLFINLEFYLWDLKRRLSPRWCHPNTIILLNCLFFGEIKISNKNSIFILYMCIYEKYPKNNMLLTTPWCLWQKNENLFSQVDLWYCKIDTFSLALRSMWTFSTAKSVDKMHLKMLRLSVTGLTVLED